MTRQLLFALAALCCASGQAYDGCVSSNGGDPLAFKRAWKDESYAMVVVNGGQVTFTGVPDGIYTDIVTGISAPEAEAAAEGEVYYSLQGIEVKHPSHGIYIMRRGTTLRRISL